MKEFQIYKNNLGNYEAIKIGWSWPAFFLSWAWFFYKKMYKEGAFVIIVLGALSFVPDDFTFPYLIAIIIFFNAGRMGNEWLGDSLEERGYKKRRKINALNSDAAISQYVDGLKKTKAKHKN